MAGNEDEKEIIYVERDSGSIKPILFGALLGLAVGLLFAGSPFFTVANKMENVQKALDVKVS